jgi:hypothetical protein
MIADRQMHAIFVHCMDGCAYKSGFQQRATPTAFVAGDIPIVER